MHGSSTNTRLLVLELALINASLTNFINSYIAEKHVVEEALKERHLIAKGVSPGYIDIN